MTAIPPFSDHLLPRNATPLEMALSASDVRMLSLPTVIRLTRDPDRCPVNLLPYLAQKMSVDEWDPAWSEAQKRQSIKDSIWIHQHKGTIGALKRSLAQLNFFVTVREWFQYGGAPYTFRLSVALDAITDWTAASYATLLRVAIHAKNVRSWLDQVTLQRPVVATPLAIGVTTVSHVRLRLINEPIRATQSQRAGVHAGAAALCRVHLRLMPMTT